MSSKLTVIYGATALLLLSGVNSGVNAQQPSRGVSYSPDHWPARWSTAIRQQQNGNYPTRQDSQTPPPELPKEINGVSDQDLFYSPSMQQHGQRQNGHAQRYHAKRGQSFNQLPRFRQFRNSRYDGMAGRYERAGVNNAAFAYYGMPAMQYGNYAGLNSGFPLGTAPIGIDPVLGHPGMGIPIMPGTPYGPPMISAPFMGNPMGYGGWPNNFGTW